MQDLLTRPKPAQELTDLLRIPSPPPSYVPVKKKEVTEVEIHPGYYTSARRADSVNEKVELVVPLSTDIGGLFKFVVTVEEKLSDFDDQATILSLRRFCNLGTVITMEIKAYELSNIINKLVNMSEVKSRGEAIGIGNGYPFDFSQ